MTAILGISAFYHDSAAALIVDGEIVAAAQEERFTRVKHDHRFPSNAIAYCLSEAGLTSSDLDYVAFYDKPLTKFERLLETYLAFAPAGLRSFSMAMPLWLKEKLHMRRTIRAGLGGTTRARLVFTDHHESHAASAFFPSPFDEAAILTLDGVGEWSTTTFGVGRGNRIELTHQIQFPHSLGLLYSAFTYYCGFKVNSGEYKLMGLAPYGRPIYEGTILEKLMDLKPDGSFWLDMAYFNYAQGLTMTGRRFHDLFGGPPRPPESMLEQRHMDLAASIQAVTEEVMLRIGQHLHSETGMKNLVLAGGVALNCVANGRLLREGPFESIWIQPAAGDAGGALGAALFVWYQLLQKPRHSGAVSFADFDRDREGEAPAEPLHSTQLTVGSAGASPSRGKGNSPARHPAGRDAQRGSFLGPKFSAGEIDRVLASAGAAGQRFEDETALLEHVAGLLAEGKIVGWFHGRMEFGPRSLGARSILGDPRSAEMQATMNLKIKYRESFRPFAPCVLLEHAHEWFGLRPGQESPYMLLVAPVLEEHRVPIDPERLAMMRDDPDLRNRVNVVRSEIPAVTHVDYSARVQTVDEDRNPRFHRLLSAFHRLTGCPVLVNTSFNVRGEPIVCTPLDAYRCFQATEMDVLVLEDVVIPKEAGGGADLERRKEYLAQFQLD